MEALLENWNAAVAQFPTLLTIAGNLTAALLIFFAGMVIGRWARKRVRRSEFGGRHLDATLKPVLASAIFYAILAMTLYAVLIKVGVPPTSLIAAFATAGLAIALSLKDTLSNIAAGIMLLILRPLAVGEYVDLGPAAGTITEVGLFATTLKSADGIYKYIPNSKVWDTRIINYGRHSIRKFTTNIGVSYDSDLRKAQAAILSALQNASEHIEDAANPPEAYVMNFGQSAVEFSCRVWLPADNWAERCSDLRIAILEALREAGVETPKFDPAQLLSKTSLS